VQHVYNIQSFTRPISKACVATGGINKPTI